MYNKNYQTHNCFFGIFKNPEKLLKRTCLMGPFLIFPNAICFQRNQFYWQDWIKALRWARPCYYLKRRWNEGHKEETKLSVKEILMQMYSLTQVSDQITGGHHMIYGWRVRLGLSPPLRPHFQLRKMKDFWELLLKNRSSPKIRLAESPVKPKWQIRRRFVFCKSVCFVGRIILVIVFYRVQTALQNPSCF